MIKPNRLFHLLLKRSNFEVVGESCVVTKCHNTKMRTCKHKLLYTKMHTVTIMFWDAKPYVEFEPCTFLHL